MELESQTVKCQICSQEINKLFTAPCDYRKPTSHRAYDVFLCTSCRYGQVWPRPTRKEVSSFYDLTDYYTHKADTNSKVGRNSDESFLDRLRFHLSWRLDNGKDLSPNDAVALLKGSSFSMLEIGCGKGGNMSRFLDQGFSVVGVEPDQKAREEAKKSNLIVYEGTAEELPRTVMESKYDVILMSHVLEHCIDINSAILNAKGLLRDRGCFIVETPNCESLGFKAQRAAWPFSDIPRHLNFFTPFSLCAILSKHGFSVVSVKYCGFCRQFSNSWLDTEKEVWRAFQGSDDQWQTEPKYKLQAWKLLISSLFSSKEAKYDSVRVIAQLF